MKELLALKRDVIVSMRTGGGKSPVAILPPMVENGYTVIILPLLALIEDWERRLTSMGIPFERYLGAAGPRDLAGRKNIILVSSDIAKGDRFKAAIYRLHTRPFGRPVLRYVVDEAEYYFMDLNFRKESLGNPYELRKFPCQVVLMAATIPPAAEKFLKHAFILSNHKRFSTCSDRPNLNVRIDQPYHKNLSSQISKAKAMIEHHLDSEAWKSNDRYLVYVNSHADGQVAAEKLGIPFYHAHSTEHPIKDEDRQRIYNDWLEGKSLGIVATTALGAGNDYAHVRFTIHLGIPFSLIEWEQQRGRAGRDGRTSFNYLLPRTSPHKEVAVDPTYGDMRGAGILRDIIYYPKGLKYPQSCVVFATTQFMDGQGFACADLARPKFCQDCRERSEWAFTFYLRGGSH